MTQIRPTFTPPLPQAQPGGQKLQGQSALFALARELKAQAATAPAAPQQAPQPSPAQAVSKAPDEPPAKVLRPGSLLDIRI